jgi:hypothetical protein
MRFLANRALVDENDRRAVVYARFDRIRSENWREVVKYREERMVASEMNVDVEREVVECSLTSW